MQHGHPSVPIPTERAAQLVGIMREGPFGCTTYRVGASHHTWQPQAIRAHAPDSTFPRPGLKVAFQTIKECNANKWHSSCTRTMATPHRDSYGPPEGATPKDRDEAIGAYLMAPADPNVVHNLLYDLNNRPPLDWPRLCAR